MMSYTSTDWQSFSVTNERGVKVEEEEEEEEGRFSESGERRNR